MAKMTRTKFNDRRLLVPTVPYDDLHLTPKQRLFVQEYLIDLNATQAAVRAGYSVRHADQLGSQLLADARMKEAVGRAMAERSRRTGITQDRVLLELARIGFINSKNVMDMTSGAVLEDATEDDTAAIASIRVKSIPTQNGEILEREVKVHDKIRALELIGKHLGLFTDKFKGELEMAVQIVDDIVPNIPQNASNNNASADINHDGSNGIEDNLDEDIDDDVDK